MHTIIISEATGVVKRVSDFAQGFSRLSVNFASKRSIFLNKFTNSIAKSFLILYNKLKPNILRPCNISRVINARVYTGGHAV